MPLYSQDDGTEFGWYSENSLEPNETDFKLNGRYCASGLAYPASDDIAVCTSFKKMMYYFKEEDKTAEI